MVECVWNLAVDARLQTALLNAGVLWYLLTFLFSYDYTLEECGVEHSEDANNQVTCQTSQGVQPAHQYHNVLG